MHTQSQWKHGGVADVNRAATRGAGCVAAAMALCLLGPPPAAAQSAAPAAAPAPQTHGRPYAFAGVALFGPEHNEQLQRQRSGLGGIAGGGYRFSPNLSFEVGVLAASQRLDTPAGAVPPAGTFRTGSLRTRMGTSGVNIGIKFSFPLGRVEPYYGAGVGRYSTRLTTTSEAFSCLQNCDDTGPRLDRLSRDTGYHAVLGADFHLRAKDVLAAEFRYLKLDASFDDIIPGKVRAGGSFLWLGYRRYF